MRDFFADLRSFLRFAFTGKPAPGVKMDPRDAKLFQAQILLNFAMVIVLGVMIAL